MLKALEANDFSQIPSEVFARGFVISYAKCLGLSEDEVFRRYRESTHGHFLKKPKTQPRPEAAPLAGIHSRLTSSRLVTTAVILGVVGIFSLAIYERLTLSGSQEGGETGPIAAPASEGSLPTKAAGPGQAPALPGTVDLSVNVPGAADGRGTAGAQGAADPLLLVIEAIDTSWVVAEIDGSRIKEVLLHPGEVVRWRAREKFVLTVGNAGGLSVQLDGKQMEPLGPKGKVLRNLILTR